MNGDAVADSHFCIVPLHSWVAEGVAAGLCHCMVLMVVASAALHSQGGGLNLDQSIHSNYAWQEESAN